MSTLLNPTYTIVSAVNKINFSIKQGERVGFIGPNGAGKSTTVNMLSGILTPTSGTINVAGGIPYSDRFIVLNGGCSIVLSQCLSMRSCIRSFIDFSFRSYWKSLIRRRKYQQRIGGIGSMIETARLVLRPMTDSDFDDVLKIFTDEKVMQSFGGELFTRDHMRHWIDSNLAHQKDYGYGLFSVLLKTTNQLIGDCELEHGTFNEKPCVEIGYDFLSDYWNQGYANEAATPVKAYAIHTAHIDGDALCSFIRQQNAASIRVSQKIGMERLHAYEKHGIAYYLYGFSREYFS